MDFRVDQEDDTRFVYVMPFNTNEALVEYTVFSKTGLCDEEYNDGLRTYCSRRLLLGDFRVFISSEFGMIPMTNFDFPSSHERIIYIGSAGGQTKASSGYTFKIIQKHSEQIVRSLVNSGSPHRRQRIKSLISTIVFCLKFFQRKIPGRRHLRKAV